jgi:hypothetical protein
MVDKCNALTKKGLRCRHDALNGSEFCAIHSPKFCRYCGAIKTNEFCAECGGSDDIEPEFEQPEAISNISNEECSKRSSNLEELCSRCGQWYPENQLQSGVCVKCITYKCKQCGCFLNTKESKILGYCGLCRIQTTRLDKCKICGHSIISDKSEEKGYCHRCYESQIKLKDNDNKSNESSKYEFNGAATLDFIIYFILISCIILTIIGFSLMFFETPPHPNYDNYTYPIPKMVVTILGHLEGY